MSIERYKGLDALEMVGQILDPIISILADGRVEYALRHGNRMNVCRLMVMEEHRPATYAILEAIYGKDGEYEAGVMKQIKDLVDLISSPEFVDFFTAADEPAEEPGDTSASTAEEMSSSGSPDTSKPEKKTEMKNEAIEPTSQTA